MKRLVRYFFEGLLFVAPIAITVFVFYKIFVFVDEPLRSIIHRVVGISVPGVGFVVTIVMAVVLLTVAGFLCSNILTRSLMQLLDRQFDRFPLVKLLHSSIKDLLGAFVGDKKKFDQPVLVTLIPGSDVKAIGFITRRSLESWGLADTMAVYLPQSYNFAGNLVIVSKAQVEALQVPSGEVMAFVVSGGVTGGEKKALQ